MDRINFANAFQIGNPFGGLMFHMGLCKAQEVGVLDYHYFLTPQTKREIDEIIRIVNEYQCTH
jgi:hypothetical protein